MSTREKCGCEFTSGGDPIRWCQEHARQIERETRPRHEYEAKRKLVVDEIVRYTKASYRDYLAGSGDEDTGLMALAKKLADLDATAEEWWRAKDGEKTGGTHHGG